MAMRPLRSRPLVSIATLAFLYFVTGRIGLSLGAVGGLATAVWPPTGLALAALLRVGPDLWPGIALGAFAVNIAAGAPWWAASLIAAGNTTAVGAMIETPAALLMVDAIAQSADFFSVGTNDLLCHLFGRERHRGLESAYGAELAASARPRVARRKFRQQTAQRVR